MSESKKEMAAILFTDLVGYSALTQKGQTKALELLRLHMNQMSPIIENFNGLIIKSIGDALMVKFMTAVDAVDCAITMQQELVGHNMNVSKQDRLQMRIGVHYGEVVLQDNDAFGSVVNIASRIEAKAAPEKVCISKVVYDQIKKTSSVLIKSLGKIPLKNIPRPVHLYMVDPHHEPSFVRLLKWPLIILLLLISYNLIKFKFPNMLEKITMKKGEHKIAEPTMNEIMDILSERYSYYESKTDKVDESLAARYSELQRLNNNNDKTNFDLRVREFSKALDREIATLQAY